jgi:RNA polymerase sigma-70 factor (ECF subfamily)
MTTTLRNAELEDHARALRAYALRHVGDGALADDLMQETLLAALGGGAAEFDGRSTVRTWLVGILKHKIADSHRARARRPLSLEELAERGIEAEQGDAEWGEGASEDDRAAFAADPETLAAGAEFLAACQSQLDRLSPKASRAFVLSDVLGHDAAEVGAMLGMTAANVWTTVHRTRRVLHDALAPSFAPA